MPIQREPQLDDVTAYMDALRDTGVTLRDQYRNDPEGLAIRLGLKLPEKPLVVMQRLGVYDPAKHGPIEPGIRDMVLDVCSGEIESAVAVGPRGGGKSQGVSFIEFFLWIIKMYDALNLGGSELQAQNVYTYLQQYVDSDPYWKSLIRGEMKISESETIDRNWIRVMAASQKSVRSPHAGGLRNVNGVLVERGGVLVIDEEAEAEADIVEAALPTVNTARPSVNLRCSTFHNAEGTFAEVVDDHEAMGYKLYRWDIFDVCEPCQCTDGCQSEEKCFRDDHYEEYIDPDTGEIERKLLHKAYCNGRARYASGWVPMAEILKLWKRMRRSHSRWEVEAMGSRPSTSGYVVKDLKKFNDNIVPETGAQLYEPGSPISICVDWGTVAAGIEVWQHKFGGTHALLHADLIEEAGQTQIFADILKYWNMYEEAQEVAADIGGGGNYLNPKLRIEERLNVRDVNFQMEKESAVAVMNIINETEGGLEIPAEHVDYIRQVRKWKRKNGHIQKGDDHLCDTSVCYFSKYIEDFGLSKVRVAGRGFSTAQDVNTGSMVASGNIVGRPRMASNRVAIARGVGTGRR